MKVGAAGAHEAAIVGELGPSPAFARVVAAIERLDAAELVLADHLERHRVVQVRVRERHRCVRVATRGDRVRHRQRLVRHVDRTAVEEVARERILHRGRVAGGDHQPREVGTPDGALGTLGEQGLDVDAHTALFEACGHHAQAVDACESYRRDPLLERGPPGAPAVERQNMNGSAFVVARDLDGTQHARAGYLDGGTCARVVVCEGKHLHGTFGGAGSDLLGGLGSVGARRVAVQLDPHGVSIVCYHLSLMGIPGVQAPTRLGRYELLARLATGGMGEIFLARLEGAAGFEKLFVVKRILPHLADDTRFRQMLIAEARLASKLSHANICQVYELGETDGQLYIVMEYLEGVTLLPLLRKLSKEAGQLDFGFVGGVVQQTTDALHYAHELKDRGGELLGIVHRDVTPSNIFLTEAGVAKVLDFGIAKVKDASANTQTGTVKGKYAYMAPEQLRGTTLDRRADVFALGVVLYEMLALRRLFQRKTDYLTFRAVMEQPIPDIRRYRPDLPDALATVLAQALDRDPNGRFESARMFGSAVLDALSPLGRVWTQGEISDYVRREFAQDINKRHVQVASAVNKTNAGQRATMPLIAHDPGPPTDIDDDDDEFPAVDSTISETPLEIRAVRPPQDTKDFASQTGQVTPPPFANEQSTSGVSIKLINGGMAMPQAVVAKPSRSLVWPLFALAMVGIAGGALFLVWKQMQQQQQQPPTVNITTEPRTDVPIASTETGSANVISDEPEPTEQPDPKTPTRTVPPKKKDPYTEALRVQRPAVNKCANQHGAPPSGVKVKILVATDGRVKGVTLDPAPLNGSPLGACIKNVLSSVQFPKAQEDKEVNVNFRGPS